MNYKKSISLVLVFCFIFTIFSSNVLAKELDLNLDKFTGTYRGSYYANQGHTGLTLKVYLEEGNYKAKFNFYSVPENPSVPSGEYICDVKYNEDNGEYVIIGKEWIDQPSGYAFVDLYGKYENLAYRGRVVYSGGSNFTFDLVKQVEENEPSKWADDTVDIAVIKGIIPLELQGNYKDSITRAEFTRLMIATISKYEGKDIEKILEKNKIQLNENVFDDTEDRFVLAAYHLNIINGYGEGKFGPDDLLTREQAAKILRSMLDLLGNNVSNSKGIKFQDEDKFSYWAKDDIKFITSCHIETLNKAIMEGVGVNFDPLGKYTKEQSYLTVYRLLEYMNK